MTQEIKPGWFPRPRGDGPPLGRAGSPVSPVPPPTRGWPRRLSKQRRADPGSPAHAGMAPHFMPLPPPPEGFPRPRGDGPGADKSTEGQRQVPPPTRGWPPCPGYCAKPWRGSPAHAGMALDHRRSRVHPLGFPRPRGDGSSIRGGLTALGRLRRNPHSARTRSTSASKSASCLCADTSPRDMSLCSLPIEQHAARWPKLLQQVHVAHVAGEQMAALLKGL